MGIIWICFVWIIRVFRRWDWCDCYAYGVLSIVFLGKNLTSIVNSILWGNSIGGLFISRVLSKAMLFIYCHQVHAFIDISYPIARFLPFQDAACTRNETLAFFWIILLVENWWWKANYNLFARLSHWFIFKIGSRLLFC